MIRLALVGSLSLLVGMGCSQDDSSQAKPAAVSSHSNPSSSSTANAAEGEIRKVSKAFLDAVVRGDATLAIQWLTPSAAGRAQADPGLLSPLGFAVESLDVQSVRLVSEFEAAAECALHEPGAAQPEVVCCLLKLGATGWRVCGMACDAGPNNPPAVISFEQEVSPDRQGESGQFVENAQITPHERAAAYTANSENPPENRQ